MDRKILVRLAGTSLRIPRGVRRETLPRSSARLTLTLHLRSRKDGKALRAVLGEIIAGRRPPMTRAEFRKEFGTSGEAVDVVRRFARQHGFRVGQVDLAKRTLHLTGPASQLAQTFGGGVNELQRELIAQFGLGMPRTSR